MPLQSQQHGDLDASVRPPLALQGEAAPAWANYQPYELYDRYQQQEFRASASAGMGTASTFQTGGSAANAGPVSGAGSGSGYTQQPASEASAQDSEAVGNEGHSPDMSVMAGDGSGKQKRISLACDQCNRRRAKCDGDRPQCATCKRLQRQCTYEREVRKRGPKSGYVDRLHERIRDLEAQVQTLKISGSPSTLPLAFGSSAAPYPPNVQGQSIATFQPGPLEAFYLTTEPHFKTEQQQQQQAFTLTASPSSMAGSVSNDALSAPASSLGGSVITLLDSTVASNNGSINRADTDIRYDLIDRFFGYIHPCIPILNRFQFLRGIQNEPPMLLNAMYALAMTQPIDFEKNTFNRGDVYFERARRHVEDNMDQPSYSVVVAFILMSFYSSGAGNAPKALLYFGIAVKMAQVIGLHMETDLTKPMQELELRRRIWFILKQMDGFVSVSRSDIPLSINEDDGNTPEPRLELVFFNMDESVELPLVDEGDGFGALYQVKTAGATAAAAASVSTTAASELSGTRPGPIPEPSPTPSHVEDIPRSAFSHISLALDRYLALLRILKKATRYARNLSHHHLTATSSLIFDPELERSILVNDASEWYASLPPWLGAVQPAYFVDDCTPERPHWMVAHTLAIYYFCRIMLYGGHLLASGEPLVDNAVTRATLATCLDYAMSICAIAERLMEQNPRLVQIPHGMCKLFLYAGMVIVVAMRMRMFDAVTFMVMHAKVEQLVLAIDRISRFWVLAQADMAKLRDALSIAYQQQLQDGSISISSGQSSVSLPPSVASILPPMGTFKAETIMSLTAASTSAEAAPLVSSASGHAPLPQHVIDQFARSVVGVAAVGPVFPGVSGGNSEGAQPGVAATTPSTAAAAAAAAAVTASALPSRSNGLS
ncbi:fungal-specific transcription factor domain-containing protein [Entophlyctis helioformis]|nr:fungal-specific transcription factor domain-containing protein [Entophlyctis helioformis]